MLSKKKFSENSEVVIEKIQEPTLESQGDQAINVLSLKSKDSNFSTFSSTSSGSLEEVRNLANIYKAESFDPMTDISKESQVLNNLSNQLSIAWMQENDSSLSGVSTSSLLTVSLSSYSDLNYRISEMEKLIKEHDNLVFKILGLDTNQNSILREQIENLKASLNDIQQSVSRIYSIENETLIHQENLALISKSQILKDYYAGFLKTAQKFCIGAMAGSSGEVEAKSVMGGYILGPIPPVIKESIELFASIGDFIYQLNHSNMITIALHSFPDPLHFAQKLIPVIAARVALSEGKEEFINKEIEDNALGVKNNIISFIDKFKYMIWVHANPTIAMKVGANDAIKLITAMKSGLIKVDSLDDKEIIEEALSVFRVTDYFENLTKQDSHIIYNKGKIDNIGVGESKFLEVESAKDKKICILCSYNSKHNKENAQEIFVIKKHWYDYINNFFGCCGQDINNQIGSQKESSIYNNHNEYTNPYSYLNCSGRALNIIEDEVL